MGGFFLVILRGLIIKYPSHYKNPQVKRLEGLRLNRAGECYWSEGGLQVDLASLAPSVVVDKHSARGLNLRVYDDSRDIFWVPEPGSVCGCCQQPWTVSDLLEDNVGRTLGLNSALPDLIHRHCLSIVMRSCILQNAMRYQCSISDAEKNRNQGFILQPEWLKDFKLFISEESDSGTTLLLWELLGSPRKYQEVLTAAFRERDNLIYLSGVRVRHGRVNEYVQFIFDSLRKSIASQSLTV